MFGVVTVIMLAIVAKETEAYRTYNTGRGMVYRLGVTQDTTLEGSTQQLDYLQYLLVSKFRVLWFSLKTFPMPAVHYRSYPLRCTYTTCLLTNRAGIPSREPLLSPALCRCCNKSIRYLGPFSLLRLNPGAYKIDLVAVQIQSANSRNYISILIDFSLDKTNDFLLKSH